MSPKLATFVRSFMYVCSSYVDINIVYVCAFVSIVCVCSFVKCKKDCFVLVRSMMYCMFVRWRML